MKTVMMELPVMAENMPTKATNCTSQRDEDGSRRCLLRRGRRRLRTDSSLTSSQSKSYS